MQSIRKSYVLFRQIGNYQAPYPKFANLGILHLSVRTGAHTVASRSRICSGENSWAGRFELYKWEFNTGIFICQWDGGGCNRSVTLRPCGPRLLSSFFVEECFLPPLRGGGGSFLILPLPLPGRGLLFARAKRSKRSLKELRSLRILLHYGGDLFCASTGVCPVWSRRLPCIERSVYPTMSSADPTVSHGGSPGAVPLEGPPSRLYPFNRPAGGVG